MMQLLQQQMLQFSGALGRRRINSCLGKQARGIDAGLRQQFTQTGVFHRQNVFLTTICHERARVDPRGAILVHFRSPKWKSRAHLTERDEANRRGFVGGPPEIELTVPIVVAPAAQTNMRVL